MYWVVQEKHKRTPHQRPPIRQLAEGLKTVVVKIKTQPYRIYFGTGWVFYGNRPHPGPPPGGIAPNPLKGA